MTHLPECPRTDDAASWRDDCICEQLKACESRVISRSMKLALSDRQLGYREGLSAAIDAIDSLRGECQNRTENGTECTHENTWFDRSLCYCEPEGTMHTICSDCGKKHLRDNQWGDCG